MRCPRLDELPAPPPGRHGWPWTEETPGLLFPGPRISVVTPSYNQSAYLEETLRSVLLQQYGDLDYVVVDGGSTDGSLDVIKKYEPWLNSWTSERDRGQCHAINKGLACCTGTYFNYVNSDDTLRPGALQAVANGFARYPSATLVHGRCVLADETGATLSVHQGQGRDFREMFDNLVAGNGLHPLAVFFRRAAVVNAGGFEERLHHEMDSDLWFRLLERGGEVRPIDACIGTFRCHGGQKSASHRRIDELLDVLLAALDRQTDLSAARRDAARQRAVRQCARQKLWAASSSFRLRRYGDYLACCFDGVRIDPGIVGSRVFWSNAMAPVKAILPAAVTGYMRRRMAREAGGLARSQN